MNVLVAILFVAKKTTMQDIAQQRRTLEHCMLGIGEFRPVFTKTHSVNFGCRPQTDNLFDSSQKNGEKAFPCSANGPVEIAICQRQIRSKGDFYCPFYYHCVATRQNAITD